MDLAGIYHDLRMDEMGDFLKVKTTAGRECIKDGCRFWTNNRAALKRRTDQVAALRSAFAEEQQKQDLEEEFAGAAACEAIVQKTLNPDGDFAEECYGQLLFRGEYTTPLNHLPFLLTILRFWKIYITPASAITMPIMAVVMPYIIIKYMFNMPMPLGAYIQILKKVYNGSLGPTAPTSQDLISKVKFYAQTGWLVFNFIQSMWAPIQAARHTYKLDETLVKEGEAIRELVLRTYTLRDKFAAAGFKSAPLSVDYDDVLDVRRAVAIVLEAPASMKLLIRQLGEYEMIWRLASCPDICLVRWTSGSVKIALGKTFDIRVKAEDRVAFDVELGGAKQKQHAILTGPNRGGKSTALRAIGRSLFLAHCFGVSVGRRATITPLRYMQTCLRLEDIPGSKSLFEREVAIASLALRRVRGRVGRGIVLIDELFHSTNPPDAEIASRIFLGELWNCKQTLSVISTHLFALAEDGTAQQLCCPAVALEDGKVKYKYGLQNGICRVSSVREILAEQGLATIGPRMQGLATIGPAY